MPISAKFTYFDCLGEMDFYRQCNNLRVVGNWESLWSELKAKSEVHVVYFQ